MVEGVELVATMTTILACLGYALLGSVVVCWRAEHRRVIRDDASLILTLLLWPIWLLASAAYTYGYKRRWR